MLPTKRVLIVDDEPNVRLMLRTALESVGYTVTEAADGQASLASLRSDGADLVLLDLQMSGLDGMEVLRRLRDDGDDVPVVVVTAHGSVPTAIRAMELGALDFLAKPIEPSVLRRTVLEVLVRRATVGLSRPVPSQPCSVARAIGLPRRSPWPAERWSEANSP